MLPWNELESLKIVRFYERFVVQIVNEFPKYKRFYSFRTISFLCYELKTGF